MKVTVRTNDKVEAVARFHQRCTIPDRGLHHKTPPALSPIFQVYVARIDDPQQCCTSHRHLMGRTNGQWAAAKGAALRSTYALIRFVADATNRNGRPVLLLSRHLKRMSGVTVSYAKLMATVVQSEVRAGTASAVPITSAHSAENVGSADCRQVFVEKK
jgi:hypothetical protein